jgi:hypothetical protein
MKCGIDFAAFDTSAFSQERIEQARLVWAHRVHTEFRSIQIMTRFLTEVLDAGDPIDVYAGAVDQIADEVRHTALCVGVCKALGHEPRFPSPVQHDMPERFNERPAGERALNTAITMLLVSETLSVGYIEDLQARCHQPMIRAVLDATLEDEEAHEGFGFDYVEASLRRFPRSTLTQWRNLTSEACAMYRTQADAVLADVKPEHRDLEAWPEPELVELGLHSRQRLALLFERTWKTKLAPRLTDLGLV